MSFLEGFFQQGQIAQGSPAERLVLGLLVAFIVGQLNAWFYKWTHHGLSYSRSFTQALILISMVAALSMSLIVTSVIAALGLLGGLAIIRFRTVVRDARDTAYVFICLVCGMAAGFGYYAAALIGSAAANLVALYLHKTEFGAWRALDSLLQFQVAASAMRSGAFEAVLARFCRQHAVISVDELPGARPEGEPACQCAYRVRLRNPEQGPDLVAALKKEFRIDAVHLLVEQEHEETA
ncbi:MAG: DUF4956 domain-containing protein [Planctomycetota bacterium]|jgi:uncharacterized membrane protein YhiD involved in acid resistance